MKPASTPPAYCVGCYQQKPDKRHVDFDAAFDGPTFDMPEVGHGIRMQIDDLILCEDCITHAGKLIGLVNADALKEENQELGEALEHSQGTIEEMRETIHGLRQANDKMMDEHFGTPKRSVSIRRNKATA